MFCVCCRERTDAALHWVCMKIGVRYQGVSLVGQAPEECLCLLSDGMLVGYRRGVHGMVSWMRPFIIPVEWDKWSRIYRQ